MLSLFAQSLFLEIKIRVGSLVLIFKVLTASEGNWNTYMKDTFLTCDLSSLRLFQKLWQCWFPTMLGYFYFTPPRGTMINCRYCLLNSRKRCQNTLVAWNSNVTPRAWKLCSGSIIPYFISARYDSSLPFHPLQLLTALQNNIKSPSFTCISQSICMDICVWATSYVAPSSLDLGIFFFLFFFLSFFLKHPVFQTRGIEDRGEAACTLLGCSSLPEPGTEPRLSGVSHWATIQNMNWSAELSKIQAV